MRFLLQVTVPNEAGNELATQGKLGSTVQEIVASLNPEAAYFTEVDGERTGFIVVNMDEPSQMASIAEPLFLGLKARVRFHPAMVAEDLAKAAPAIDEAARRYGGAR